MTSLRSTLLLPLLALLLPLPLLAGPAVSASAADTHDAFTSHVRVHDHGRCHVSKSDAAVRARLACPDGFRRSLRPCPQEDSRRCFWHAPTRGDGRGRSFVALAGRWHYFRA